MTATDFTLNEQLDKEKRAVSYDVYDMTVRQLVDMISSKEIDIAPDYQRRFVWDPDRESELIESIYLGIPVPSLYMAANRDGTWEVVDGVQRISTLVHFCADEDARLSVGKTSPLKIGGLKKLSKLNGLYFHELPKSVQLSFTLRPIRITTLNDKSDASVRYDLFERLNTGGVKLHDQEIRNCVMRGVLRDMLSDLSARPSFRHVVRLPDNEQASAMYEECVLRFFAYLARYGEFEHSVVDFLNSYMKDYSRIGPNRADVLSFEQVLAFLEPRLPNGVVRGRRTTTPLNLFEAVFVGTALALRARPDIDKPIVDVIDSTEMRRLTTGATNSRRMVADRIHFIRDYLLN